MADMTTTDVFLREQLLDRRQRLEFVVAGSREPSDLVRLLDQVDSALERMNKGTYGICDFVTRTSAKSGCSQIR